MVDEAVLVLMVDEAVLNEKRTAELESDEAVDRLRK
jgi:hypothetical protein